VICTWQPTHDAYESVAPSPRSASPDTNYEAELSPPAPGRHPAVARLQGRRQRRPSGRPSSPDLKNGEATAPASAVPDPIHGMSACFRAWLRCISMQTDGSLTAACLISLTASDESGVAPGCRITGKTTHVPCQPRWLISRRLGRARGIAGANSCRLAFSGGARCFPVPAATRFRVRGSPCVVRSPPWLQARQTVSGPAACVALHRRPWPVTCRKAGRRLTSGRPSRRR
jgi:hypothetical protein